mmetsp:Transcript_27074/g.38559  ORF Transcript_27074/g.38559 Transcript_27074/m.38559 type:complete len:240 (-) Transcript_27074:217-936(-)
MESIDNLRVVISRIASYICKCKNEFHLANINNLNILAKYIKIYKLFFWNGSLDIEAIDTLSMLCHKRGINDYFEYQCSVRFQQSGKHKEIGVTSASSIGIEQQEFLIRTCFPKQQVLDLVVNGPLKAHIKGLRAARVFNYFQQFKIIYEEEKNKPVEERKRPKWNCPKPTLHQCIKDLMAIFQNGPFVQQKLKELYSYFLIQLLVRDSTICPGFLSLYLQIRMLPNHADEMVSEVLDPG